MSYSSENERNMATPNNRFLVTREVKSEWQNITKNMVLLLLFFFWYHPDTKPSKVKDTYVW